MELKLGHIVFILATMLLTSCEKDQWDDCFTSTGSMTEQHRTVGEFYGIELHDRIDLVLEERSTGTLIVEAGSNLLGQIETNVGDGWLTIRNYNKCNWMRSFKPRITIRVSAEQVAFLMLNGTGNISSSTTIQRSVFRLEQRSAQGSAELELDVDTCYAGLHSGAGNVTYTGSATVAYLYSGTMGHIDAMGLDAEVTVVNNSGVADIHCKASNNLDAQIFDVGDIYYSGEPQITSQLVGSGQLIKVE